MVNLTSENGEFDPHNPQLWPHWPHGILWIPRGPSARVLQHCWREWLAFLRRLHVNDRVSSLTKIVKRGMLMFDMFWYGYGSIAMKIPLNKGVIHIHKSQLFWCELQGYYWFWHTAISPYLDNIQCYMTITFGILYYYYILLLLLLLLLYIHYLYIWISSYKFQRPHWDLTGTILVQVGESFKKWPGWYSRG